MKPGKMSIAGLMLLLLLLMSGCAFKDIDRRFFVVTIGVDKATNPAYKYKVLVKLAIPSPQERFGANQSILVTQEANSITEAVRQMKGKVDKELDFGQAKSIVFGQDIVKEDINELIDWFVRRRDIQKIAWMGVGVPNAEAILNLKPKTERLPSNMIFLFFGRTGTETSYVTSEYLFDFRRRLKERGLDPILPVMEAREQDQMTVNKTVIFNKSKQKLILSPEETKILNGFYIGPGRVEIAVNQDDKQFYVSADSVKSNFKITGIASGQPKIVIDVRITGVIEEAHSPLNESELKLYEKLSEKSVKDNTMGLLKKLQKAGVDPLGFGLRYRAMTGGTESSWKQWQSLYPDIGFEVNSKVKIRSTGTIE